VRRRTQISKGGAAMVGLAGAGVVAGAAARQQCVLGVPGHRHPSELGRGEGKGAFGTGRVCYSVPPGACRHSTQLAAHHSSMTTNFLSFIHGLDFKPRGRRKWRWGSQQ